MSSEFVEESNSSTGLLSLDWNFVFAGFVLYTIDIGF